MRFAVYSAQRPLPTRTTRPSALNTARTGLRLGRLLRPHWKPLTIALVAVIGEALADIAEPWPVTIVVDSVLGAKKPPQGLDRAITFDLRHQHHRLLEFALAAVISSRLSAASAPTSKSI